MFGFDFYPTPPAVISDMLAGLSLEGKTVLEPSAGKGNIVTALQEQGARVIACEIDKDLLKILQTKCEIIGEDFLKIESDKISHVDFIVMNPPFSRATEHILHAFNIAPAGCQVVALCNSETLKNSYSKSREELKNIVQSFGSAIELGDVFSQAERKTEVNVSLIRLFKPGENSHDFEVFFMEEDEEEKTGPGLMPFNVVRELVNRYVESLKIFDQQLETAERLGEMTGPFLSAEIGFTVTSNNKPLKRNEFKKSLQKSGWLYIFSKLNMEKHATQGLREDINKFVEKQEHIPFTMRNIYKMLEIVIGTTESRMDRAIIEVFDKVTKHHADNKYNAEGWKTNSHYLLTRRFIMPSLTKVGWSGQMDGNYSDAMRLVEDMQKALCYITGENYEDWPTLHNFLLYRYFLLKDDKFVKGSFGTVAEHHESNIKSIQERTPGSKIFEPKKEWGKWFEWSFFRIRAYKKGTIHFEFKDEKVWALFNQRVAKIKGYPLSEHKHQTTWQNRQNGYKDQKVKPVILETIKI